MHPAELHSALVPLRPVASGYSDPMSEHHKGLPGRLPRRLTAAACILAIMLSTTTPALADGADPTNVVVDVLVARPISFVATVAGSVLFVVSLPIAAAAHSVDATSQTLVALPARDLLKRPVGDLTDWFSY